MDGNSVAVQHGSIVKNTQRIARMVFHALARACVEAHGGVRAVGAARDAVTAVVRLCDRNAWGPGGGPGDEATKRPAACQWHVLPCRQGQDAAGPGAGCGRGGLRLSSSGLCLSCSNKLKAEAAQRAAIEEYMAAKAKEASKAKEACAIQLLFE